jgi:hypothetical protein
MARTDPRPHYGTKRRLSVTGYIDLYRPEHPLARADGYVSEHRFVLHEAGVELGDRQVHHRNGDKTDNRLENLAVVTAAEHSQIHWDERRPDSCPKGHEFTTENTARNPSGWRYCKQCNRDRARANKQRAKQAA